MLRQFSAGVRCRPRTDPVQVVNTDYYQNNYDFYVQDDFKATSKLTFNLGVRWQILPGMYEKNGYVTNTDLTLPNTAAGTCGARCGLRRRREQDVHNSYYKQIQPRLGMAYAVSASHGDQRRVQLEQPARDGLQRQRRIRRPQLDRLQRQHLGHARDAADPNAQDPVMYRSEPYPGLRRRFRTTTDQLNNQSVTVIPETRRNASSTTTTTSRCGGSCRRTSRRPSPTSALRHPLSFDSEINRVPFDSIGRYGDLLFSSLSSQPQLGTRSVSGLHGNRAAGAAALSAVHGRDVPEQTSRARPDTTRCRPRSSVISGTDFAVLAAYTLSKTEDTC